MSQVGVVLIGRNEGDRLVRALDAALRDCGQVVYVDSGSSDNSIAEANSRGVQVVELDTTIPFTAARARNSGFEALMKAYPEVDYVQFIDGDCLIEEGWIDKARAELDRDDSLTVLFGRRREERPEVSVFHRIIDMEWDVTPGPVASCGGDAMMRVDLFGRVGGYDPTVAAGEEPELCMRLRDRGAKILCLDQPMTRHDAQIFRLSQYLRRDIRTGRGATDVWLRFPRTDNPFNFLVMKLFQWGWGLMALFLFGAFLVIIDSTRWFGVGVMALCLFALFLRSARQVNRAQRRGLSQKDAVCFGCLTPISTCAQMYGQLMYFVDRACKRQTRLVEYKTPGNRPGPAEAKEGVETT